MEQVRDAMIQARDWLDEYGMGAWIAAMVLGFIVFFPIGLGILAYLLWSGRMGCGRSRRHWRRGAHWRGETGNAAFDSYREQTLKRLEEERAAFTEFMERLRKAKDQAEFDQFMRERSQGGPSGGPAGGSASSGPAPSGGSAGPNPGWGGSPQTA